MTGVRSGLLHHDAIYNSSTVKTLNASQPGAALSKTDYESLSEFRYQLRRFLRFSEDAAQSEGLTPQQYLLMLHARHAGRDWASVGELAERLQTVHHAVVALVSRCEAAAWCGASPARTTGARCRCT
jgi:DNA-binding MarR family transcriptional regulator